MWASKTAGLHDNFDLVRALGTSEMAWVMYPFFPHVGLQMAGLYGDGILSLLQ